MASFNEYKASYDHNWSVMQIRPSRANDAKKQAKRLLDGRAIYSQVESRTGVPWWFVGLCHYRESTFKFDTYLGNGQPLAQRTTIVPKGRGPFTGPNAFVDGAVDALRLEGFVGASDWGIARTLFRLEGFNGYGYHPRGVNSPYLYGGSTVYGPPESPGGKYIRDHVFDGSVNDPQLGTAVILLALTELEPSITFGSGMPTTSLEPDDELARDILWVQRSLNTLGANPVLEEDGKNGPKTKAAISQFQQTNGLDDTGLPDANTVTAIDRKIHQPTGSLSESIGQKLEGLENLLQSMRVASVVPSIATNRPGQPPSQLAELVTALGGAVQKIQTTMPNENNASTSEQARLRNAMDLLSAVLTPSTDRSAPLGQVNGALGDTIGRILDGKKSAIGIGGAVLTQLLSQVPTTTGVGQVLTQLTPAAGLSGFTMPVFLGLAAWGVLGKLEKWSKN